MDAYTFTQGFIFSGCFPLFFQHICRRLYCPVGDFMDGCRCVQLIKPLSGMPILFTIKMIPRDGHLTALDDNQIPKVRTSLRKRMRDISENISIDFITMYGIKTGLQEYFLFLAVVRSFPDNDTKDTMKPFLEYLDKQRFEIAYQRNSYYGKLTSRVRLWEQKNGTGWYQILQDLESKIREQKEIISNPGTAAAYGQKFQTFSPLLYCNQIQLNDTDFEVRDDGLFVVTNSRKIELPYFRLVSPSLVRICADRYLNMNKNAGFQVNFSIYVRVLVVALARCVAFCIVQ